MPDYHYADYEEYVNNDGNVFSLDNSSKFTNTNNIDSGYDNLVKFTGFFDNRYVDPFVTGYSFVFVTKPKLFIDPVKPKENSDILSKMAYENMERDPFFAQFLATEVVNMMDLNIAKLLSYKSWPEDSFRNTNFIPIFTNRIRNMQGGSLQLKSFQEFTTKKGYHIPMPQDIDDSNLPGTVNINIPETGNLDVTKLLGLWVKYMDNVSQGVFQPNPESVRDGILDYMCSIYYFVLNPDGKTIKYWVKYTGCYPTEVPSTSLTYNRGSSENVDISVNFQYTVKEEMNPDILKEFNLISLNFARMDDLYASDMTDNHSAIKQSVYLSLNGLKSIDPDLVSYPDRDPLIILRNSNSDGLIQSSPTSSAFELSFGKSSYTSAFSTQSYGDNYLYDITDVLGDLT